MSPVYWDTRSLVCFLSTSACCRPQQPTLSEFDHHSAYTARICGVFSDRRIALSEHLLDQQHLGSQEDCDLLATICHQTFCLVIDDHHRDQCFA